MCSQQPGTAQSVCDIENETVRVTRWTFAPGAETGHHRHDYDYVICPVTDGRMRIDTDNESFIAELTAGVSYFRKGGVTHNVTNVGGTELIFVETELLEHPA